MRADLQTGRGQPSNTGPGLDRDTASRTGTLTFLPIMHLFLLLVGLQISSLDRFADVCQQSFLGPQDKILDRDTFPFWLFYLLIFQSRYKYPSTLRADICHYYEHDLLY